MVFKDHQNPGNRSQHEYKSEGKGYQKMPIKFFIRLFFVIMDQKIIRGDKQKTQYVAKHNHFNLGKCPPN